MRIQAIPSPEIQRRPARFEDGDFVLKVFSGLSQNQIANFASGYTFLDE